MASTLRFDKWENTLGQAYTNILQVKTSEKIDTFATTPGALWADIPNLSVTITPKFSNSKILILADIKAAGTADQSIVRSKVIRGVGGSFLNVGVGTAVGSRSPVLGQFYINVAGAGIYYMAQIGGIILDSPSTTNEITYKAQIGGDSNSLTLYVNRTQGDRDGAYQDGRGYSSITAMEIAQ
jgi:hypothetical protein